MIHVCLEKKIAIKATQVHIKVKIMYFYLLLFFSKAIFWGEDWDPQKMLGTPIWSDMWVPGPRMKNPSAIPDIDVFGPSEDDCRLFIENSMTCLC